MSQIPNLENAPINLTAIRARARSELEIILKNIRGDKCLVMDPKLGGSLSFLIHSSDLKEHGVELRYLTPEPIQTERTKVVYLVRAQLDCMKFISSHIHNDTSKGIQREYHLYFVPRRLVVCEKILIEEKVHSLLNIGEFPLYMMPLDEDVLSFELDLAQKEYLVDGDTTCLWHIAKAIHNLEFSFGVIPNIMSKGKAAAQVAHMLGHLQAEESANTSDMNVPEINTLILLDREVDMVTPMCSQMTYEGLLDEFIGINNGALEVDASVMGVQQEGKKTKVPLNSSDKLYKEIRDLNFEVVIQVLRQKATSMKQDYTDITNTTQVSELKDFVRKLHSLPEMTRHINLAQHLSTLTSKPSFHGKLDMEQTLVEAESYEICFDYVEELIHKQEPLEDVLRLLVLLSITNSGLPKKNFDYLRREFLHSYGFEHISTLYNLEKAGLFKKQDSKSNWLTIKRAFQLVVENRDTSNTSPKDISYVFSGYAPLSVRLIQQAMRSGWRPIEEILKLLPGPHFETKRRGMSYEKQPGYTSSSEILDGGRRPLVFVVFIGGVTFAEISALRFLSSQEGMAYELLVGATKIVNGRSLIETFVDKLG